MTDIGPAIGAYRELMGAHPSKRFDAREFEWAVRNWGAIYALRVLTGKPVDITMHALDRERARTKERISA